MATEDNGFTLKRYSEILEDINADFSSNAGISIDTSSNSVANAIDSAIANQLSSLWELGEGLNDARSITAAEGQALDDLALQVGLIREPAKQSSGIVYFTGSDGTTITTSSIISTARGDKFNPAYAVTISPTSCTSTQLTINTVLEETVYQVSVDGTQFNYTSLVGDTSEDIVTGLATVLAAGSSTFTVSIPTTGTLQLDLTDDRLDSGDSMIVTAVTYISFSNVTSIGIVLSTEYGYIEGAASTLTFISTPINGWSSVINTTDVTIGNYEQTDTELRASILSNYEVKESTTYQGIKSALEDVTGVTSVSIFANQEFYSVEFNGVSVKGKSFMCTVDGGVQADIGAVLLKTKPLSTPTSGSISVDVVDDDGQTHTVYYSTAVKQYFYMKITGTLYLEEDYPTDGDTLVAETCLLYGDGLGIGEDVIPQRFEGSVFEEVSGIDELDIQVAYSTNPALDIDDASLTYTSSRVPMSTTESPLFATTRMEVSIV